MTKLTKILLEIFEKTNSAVSTRSLIKQLQGKMNRVTVYRIIDRLEKEGILHFFTGKDGLKYYAKSKVKDHSIPNHMNSHPHFQCRNCGKIECLHIDVLIPSVVNYKIDTVELLLTGKCKNCLS